VSLCIIQNIPIPDKGEPCDLWIDYFGKLKDRFGKENARMIWLKTWEVNGSIFCTTQPHFTDFVQKNGIDVSNALTRGVANATELSEGLMDLANMLVKSTKVVVPALLLIVLYFIAKSAKSLNPADVVGMLPQARMAKMSGAGKLLGNTKLLSQ